MVIVPFVPMIFVAGPTAPSSILSDGLVTDDVVTATAIARELSLYTINTG